MKETIHETVARILAEFNDDIDKKRQSGAVEEVADEDIIEVDHFPYSSGLPLGDDEP